MTTDLREITHVILDRIELIKHIVRLRGFCENRVEPSGSIKVVTFLTNGITISGSRSPCSRILIRGTIGFQD
jgi:hypothetical protein